MKILIGMFLGFICSYIIFIKGKTVNNNMSHNDIIKTLIRGCSRWAVASKQDKSPLISLLHANYAAGYLWAVKDVFTSEQINKATNINIIEFQNKITDIQDTATKNVTKICPEFSKDLESDKELLILAGNTV